jgi:hypothetical protein
MTQHHYGILIWSVCLVSWALVWLPALVHLSMTWYRGRNRVFKQLRDQEIRLYYRYFAPTEMPKDVPPARHFERYFAHVYGRRRYVIPLALLLVVSGCGFCATAGTILIWQGAGPYWIKPATGAAAMMVLPGIAVASFLGAFTWVVTDQLQRLRRGDLTQHDVAVCVLRLLVAIPFGYAFSSWATESFGVPLAFLLGTFPTGALSKAGQRIVTRNLQLGEDDSRLGIELEQLQSVSRSNAERFMEAGISTIAELANSDPVDLALRTNQSFDYVVDCCAQGLVWVYFTDKTKLLARYSLRSVHEVTWLIGRLGGPDGERRTRAQAVVDELARALEMTPSAIRHTLDRIAESPFTRFLSEIGSRRTQIGIEVAAAASSEPGVLTRVDVPEKSLTTSRPAGENVAAE